MVFIDVHCHLDFFSDAKVLDAVEKARAKNVGIIVVNSVNPKSRKRIIELAKKFEEIKEALGVYPTDALDLSGEELDEEINIIRKSKNRAVAVGEVGLDLKESIDLENQKIIFKKFIDLALELDKPIIVHSRKAEEACINILEENNVKKVIMHCFSGSMNLVKRINKNKWYFSIPANVKYSKQMQNIVKEVPISQLFCETDSPFLHPDKKRNNTPENVIEAYKKISEIKGIDIEEAERKIEENYKKLFG